MTLYTLDINQKIVPANADHFRVETVVKRKSNVVPLATPKHMEYLAHQMKCIVRDAGGLSVEDYDNGPEAA